VSLVVVGWAFDRAGDGGNSASNKDFARIQWNRVEPMGVGALQSKNRLWLRSGRNQMRFLTLFQFSAAPPPLFAVVARLEAAPARRSVLPSFTRRLGLPELPEPSKESIAADGGAWQGNRASARADGGGRFFSKIASLAALAINGIGSEPMRRP
jgi:hypothetical protein